MVLPANSTDLGPIENVWLILMYCIEEMTIVNANQLFEEAYFVAWHVTTEESRVLIQSIPRRCLEVSESRGGSTSNSPELNL